jgi:hypothetical protein
MQIAPATMLMLSQCAKTLASDGNVFAKITRIPLPSVKLSNHNKTNQTINCTPNPEFNRDARTESLCPDCRINQRLVPM